MTPRLALATALLGAAAWGLGAWLAETQRPVHRPPARERHLPTPFAVHPEDFRP